MTFHASIAYRVILLLAAVVFASNCRTMNSGSPQSQSSKTAAGPSQPESGPIAVSQQFKAAYCRLEHRETNSEGQQIGYTYYLRLQNYGFETIDYKYGNFVSLDNSVYMNSQEPNVGMAANLNGAGATLQMNSQGTYSLTIHNAALIPHKYNREITQEYNDVAPMSLTASFSFDRDECQNKNYYLQCPGEATIASFSGPVRDPDDRQNKIHFSRTDPLNLSCQGQFVETEQQWADFTRKEQKSWRTQLRRALGIVLGAFLMGMQ